MSRNNPSATTAVAQPAATSQASSPPKDAAREQYERENAATTEQTVAQLAGERRDVVAVATLLGGTPADPEEFAPGATVSLPLKEARRLVDLGLARWPGEAANAVSTYDEAIKDTTAKAGEGKADEAAQRAEEN